MQKLNIPVGKLLVESAHNCWFAVMPVLNAHPFFSRTIVASTNLLHHEATSDESSKINDERNQLADTFTKFVDRGINYKLAHLTQLQSGAYATTNFTFDENKDAYVYEQVVHVARSANPERYSYLLNTVLDSVDKYGINKLCRFVNISKTTALTTDVHTYTHPTYVTIDLSVTQANDFVTTNEYVAEYQYNKRIVLTPCGMSMINTVNLLPYKCLNPEVEMSVI